MSSHELDKATIRKAFARAAATYDSAAVFQREIAARSLDHLNPIRIDPALALDLGCGTGHALDGLSRRFPRASICAVDQALPMLLAARRRRRFITKRLRYICADADALPLPDASVDLIFSNLMLQWSPDLENTFRESRRVLRAGGLLMFSTLGPDTLSELRSAWRAVDDRQRVHRFLDMHAVGDGLVAAGFAAPVLEAERWSVTYHRFGDLLRDLKALGATNASRSRSRGMLGRNKLAALEAAYRGQQADNVALTATYEVIFGHGWVDQDRNSNRIADGSIGFPLSRLTMK